MEAPVGRSSGGLGAGSIAFAGFGQLLGGIGVQAEQDAALEDLVDLLRLHVTPVPELALGDNEAIEDVSVQGLRDPLDGSDLLLVGGVDRRSLLEREIGGWRTQVRHGSQARRSLVRARTVPAPPAARAGARAS